MNHTTRRVLYISPTLTIRDSGLTAETPAGVFGSGFAGFLTRVARVTDGQATILLDAEAAERFGLPTDPAGDLTMRADSFVEGSEWKGVGKFDGWTTFYDGTTDLNVAVLPLLELERYPLFPEGQPQPMTTVDALEWAMDACSSLDLWHEYTGVGWMGTPGVAAGKLMRATMPAMKVSGKDVEPTWKPAVIGPEDASEGDYTLRWRRGEPPHGFDHAYDANRMYLAAAAACETLAPWTLKHEPERRTFDRKRAGWWKCELAPWNDERIPNPAGLVDGNVAWLTTPTVVLLEELREAGVYDGVRILEAWTAPGKRLLRKWAETLEGAFQRSQAAMNERYEDGTPHWRCRDAERVEKALKAVYRQGHGMLKTNTARHWINRPDWHYAVIALARCNLWRKMWAVGRTENRWPIAVDVDNVWYGADAEDPEQAKPRGLVIGTRLGQFKVKETKVAA